MCSHHTPNDPGSDGENDDVGQQRDSEDLRDLLKELLDRQRALENQIEAQQGQIEDLETENEDLRDRLDAAHTQRDYLQDQISELQDRELEKGAHLEKENVHYSSHTEDRLQTIAKEDGKYYVRLEGTEEDPLSPGGQIALSAEDLLPIQQLAHLDDSMLAKQKRPAQIAAKVWRDREKASPDLWQKGSMGIKQYLDAGDLARWIRYQNDDVDRNYAKTLAGRVISFITEFSNNRLYAKLRERRSNGLNYQEKRLILAEDAEIPGEMPHPNSGTSPGTGEVTG